eukprot:353893-Chlamydomonas_euryale.AAC.15
MLHPRSTAFHCHTPSTPRGPPASACRTAPRALPRRRAQHPSALPCSLLRGTAAPCPARASARVNGQKHQPTMQHASCLRLMPACTCAPPAVWQSGVAMHAVQLDANMHAPAPPL